MVKNTLGFPGLFRTVGHQYSILLFIPFTGHADIREKARLPTPYFLRNEVMGLHFVVGFAT
nr:hypothetical protein [Pseudomonas sp. CVAP\